MPVFKTIDITNDSKHAIVHGIFTAITHDIPEIISDYRLPTVNGVGQFRWNLIHRRVEENLGGRFQSAYVSRGAWKLLLLFEMELGFTFSIMSEGNLARLRKCLPKNPHYLEALNSRNVGYKVMEGQMRLEGCEQHRNPSDVEKLRDALLIGFAGIVRNHILILFDYHGNNITSVKAALLTPQLDVAFEEDWSCYLNTPYSIGKASRIDDMITDDSEPLIQLKSKPHDNDDSVLISLPMKSKIVNT